MKPPENLRKLPENLRIIPKMAENYGNPTVFLQPTNRKHIPLNGQFGLASSDYMYGIQRPEFSQCCYLALNTTTPTSLVHKPGSDIIQDASLADITSLRYAHLCYLALNTTTPTSLVNEPGSDRIQDASLGDLISLRYAHL